MNKPLNLLRNPIYLAIAATLILASCAKKPKDTAVAPPPDSSSPAATASPPASTTSPSTVSPSTTAPSTTSSSTKPAVSAQAAKLGVKPENATTCPTNAPVKGNVTKKRGEIYFTSKFPDYKTVKPEICFKDTATAEKAGFRAPK